MSSVVDIRAFFTPGAAPTLVLLDLQQEYLAGTRMLAPKDCESALQNCHDALRHARRMGFPVAFVRWSGRSAFFNTATPYYRWIDRFEPRGSDMIFERDKPSCFSSHLFADVMANSSGPIVLAGFSGEAACLSTAIDAFHRGYDFIFLTDASASHAIGGTSGGEMHAVLTNIIRLYGAVADTQGWVRTTSAVKSHE
jgi:nicotinamidase-related amidase